MTNYLYPCGNLFLLHGMNSATIDLIYLVPPVNGKRSSSAPIGN